MSPYQTHCEHGYISAQRRVTVYRMTLKIKPWSQWTYVHREFVLCSLSGLYALAMIVMVAWTTLGLLLGF